MRRGRKEPFHLEKPDGTDGPHAWGIVEIDPRLAEQLLLGVPMGDAGSKAFKDHVAALGRDMAADDFPFTGDSVVVATDGILNDGRARCQAAVRTRTSFWALLATGADPEARFHTDLREGGTYPPAPAPAVALAVGGLDEARGLVLRACALARQLDVRRAPDATPGAEPGDLDRSFALAKGVPERGGLNRASLAAFHYLAGGRDARRAESFLAALRDGAAAPGSDVAALSGALAGAAVPDGAEAALAEMAHAWFCMRTGLAYVPGEASASPEAVEDVLGRFGLPRSRCELPGPSARVRAARRGKPRAAMEVIGPAKARRMFDTVGSAGMADYAGIADDLRNGRWAPTLQTVKVGADGRLADGRRRLSAVIETGIPIKVLVVRGLDRAAVAKLNRGRKQSLGHRLQAEGDVHKQPYDIAAAARNLLRYLEGDHLLEPSVPAMRAAMLSYPAIVEGVRLVLGLKRAYRMRVGVAASCYAIMAREDEAAARLFLHRLLKTPTSDSGEPVLELRKRLMAREGRPPDTAAGHAAMTSWILDAWRDERTHVREGKTSLAAAE